MRSDETAAISWRAKKSIWSWSGTALLTRVRSSPFNRSTTSNTSALVTRSCWWFADTLAISALISACLVLRSSSNNFLHLRNLVSMASMRLVCVSMEPCKPRAAPPSSATWTSRAGCFASKVATFASRGRNMTSMKRSVCSCCLTVCLLSLSSKASSSERAAKNPPLPPEPGSSQKERTARQVPEPAATGSDGARPKPASPVGKPTTAACMAEPRARAPCTGVEP
mmetsp:Transcript_35444/g.89260  ORF Transcript_35444/g.89260 Transcript_35444/m.89260 type:complete len:225 (+) Transcript_35444:1597-2271(+)